ncbi:uncharacterized protein A4U43_C07F26140 [Asparagus officinalis]|uniref:Very-long-chain (3R)-3-hydroxyacyl-CoA dehydratase n=1 Tax=Asparagus officinalis TaxID=4686 RepID=A0A5P1EF23_ASPOF|nr:uncharacterized protein A4U43_C07F26140 [Asparagus officinalis]
MILRLLPIQPLTVRPSVMMDNSTRSEDDKLQDVLRHFQKDFEVGASTENLGISTSTMHMETSHIDLDDLKVGLLYDEVPMIGLKTPFRDGLLRHIAKDVLKLAKDGLERRSYKEARFLREVAEVVNSGKNSYQFCCPDDVNVIFMSQWVLDWPWPLETLHSRYNTFLILYPPGITSEDGMIFIALAYIKASEKYFIRIPNKWNFSFDYFYAAIIALGNYVPRSPHMYTYMLGQRKKDLSKAKME